MRRRPVPKAEVHVTWDKRPFAYRVEISSYLYSEKY